jgi:hypothetical protein
VPSLNSILSTKRWSHPTDRTVSSPATQQQHTTIDPGARVNPTHHINSNNIPQSQVLEYRFPGHPAPPLGLMVKIALAVENWLQVNIKNLFFFK